MESTRWVPWLAALCSAGAALAQPMGPGGMGPGMHMGPDNTPGWKLMTKEERDEHREKMMSMKSADECRTYMTEHHRLMQERAKAKGVTLREPRPEMCDRMFKQPPPSKP